MRKWSEAFEDDGEVEEGYRSGRPKLLSEKQMDKIVSAALDEPKASTPRQLKHRLDLSCSAKTVGEYGWCDVS